MKSMLKPLAMTVVVFFAFIACNTSDFSSKVEKRPPPVSKNHVIKSLGMDENMDGGQKKIAVIDSVDFIIQAADNRILDTDVTTSKQPVDLFFVLDTTASMKSVITAIKNGINQLVDTLGQSGVSVHVGVVGFVDSFSAAASKTFDITSDTEAFKSFLSGLTTTSNDDFPESSLYAAQRAIELFRNSGAGRAEAVKVVLLISDVIGHNGSTEDGGSPTRDCSLAQLRSDIDGYSASLNGASALKFFYLVPDPILNYDSQRSPGARMNCVEQEDMGSNALQQMRSLMDSILPQITKSERGGPVLNSSGNMAWPLTSNNMVDTLAPMLETSSVSEDMKGSCLAQSAKLLDGTRELYSWQANDLREVFAAYESDNELELKRAINDNISLGTQELQLEVQRCCVMNSDLNSSSPRCFKSYKQTIRYEIVGNRP